MYENTETGEYVHPTDFSVCVCVWRERVVKAGYELVRAYAHIQLMHKYKYSLHLTDFAISFTGQIQYESNGMGGGGGE